MFVCTKPGLHEVREEVEDRISKIATDTALYLTYIKSEGPALMGGKENLMLISAERTPYENPNAFNSDDVQIVATS